MIRRAGKPPVTLKSGAEPYEIGILLVCLLWGVFALTGVARLTSNSTRQLPTWGVYLFFSTLAVGSALALGGVIAERVFLKLAGFQVERAGQCALVGLSISYSVWTWTAFGRSSVSFILFLAVIWGAGAFRVWRITRDLRNAAKATLP